MKNIKKIELDNYLETETIDTGETYYLEEELYIDENSIKNKSLVRVDINIVQFPIFSKNTKKRKNEITTYYFNKNRDTYITVTPSAGEYIPGETEEVIFIALMSIMKRNGMRQEFYTTSSEIKLEAKINSKNYNSIIKNSLMRLSSTNYNFKNTMYSSENKGVISEEVSTPILTFKAKSLLEKNHQHLRAEFNDKRVKEAYWIKISDHFYDNMVKKGYLVYDSDLLLDLKSSIARTIYMLIEKLRFNQNYLKIDTVFLIKRIPLKFEKRNLSQTVKTLEGAFKELTSKNLIEKFNFLKESTWLKSEIEIYFPEISIVDKQNRFFEDLNYFKRISSNMLISDMEHEVITNEIENKNITPEMIDEIFKLMPKEARKLATMPKTIYDALLKFGFKKVKNTANYMASQKNLKSPRAYFLKALENDWAQDIVDIVENKKLDFKENTLNFNRKIELEKKQNQDILFSKFEKLPLEIQNGIEGYVYRDYIQLCGMETKVQQLAFLGSRKKLICDYLEKYPQLIGESFSTEEKQNQAIEENLIILIDKEKLRNYVDEYVNIYIDLIKEENSNLEEIKKKIILECMRDFLNKTLTLEKLEDIIKKNLI
ncbi:MAG: hypothetical protein RRZ91_09455 [Cetobacterium sp.]|uniref:replication initiator protein A n=2 Tax=Cetobacterium sp. TaxID=2071632 RepID=UPI002FC99FF4